MVDVSVIIVNYNTLDLTIACVNSIYAQTKDVSFEIIVIDNASSDGSGEYLKSENRIDFIESDKNLGFGGANNIAAQKARGEYLFFLNSDTALMNNAIGNLLSFMKSNPKAGICGGNLYDVSGKLIHSHMMIMPSLFHEINSLLLGLPLRLMYGRKRIYNPTNSPLEVAYVTGADLFISKSLFNSLGGFDPIFFMYYEETELTYRVKKLGLRVFNVPNAKTIHLEGQSFSIKGKREEEILKSRKLFLVKVYGNFYYYCCNVIYFFKCINLCFFYSLNANQGKKEYWKFKLKCFSKKC